MECWNTDEKNRKNEKKGKIGRLGKKKRLEDNLSNFIRRVQDENLEENKQR